MSDRSDPSFLERVVGKSILDFTELPPERRGPLARGAIQDLNFFFEGGRPIREREAEPRSLELAQSLLEALTKAPDAKPEPAVEDRILTDEFLRSEADRDQNVYLGRLFTRRLTQAVPDVIFQPASTWEAALAFRWARSTAVPVTLRGAASTAMGGSVPHDGGLTLDLARLDGVAIHPSRRAVSIGAGARMRTVHQKLSEDGLALCVYPSNLGGTFAGWFATGGIGMNAMEHGRALDCVRSAEVLLFDGTHVRVHDNGLTEWLSRGTSNVDPPALSELAGSEGIYGLLLELTVSVEERPEIGAFLLSFHYEADALRAAEWIIQQPPARFPRPANLKFLSASHLHHTRRVWQDEDARDWHQEPSKWCDGSQLPWKRIVGPEAVGVSTDNLPTEEHAGAYLFVDFKGLEKARKFATVLSQCPGGPLVLGEESVRFAAERFKPQQTKRLGPGLLAAEILMPTQEVARFLPGAARLVVGAGNTLDAEVYYLSEGTSLVIGGYLTDHRTLDFAVDLMIAPALLDFAMSKHGGRPYVLGRWQAQYARKKLGAAGMRAAVDAKKSLDPERLLNRGVVLQHAFRGGLGALLQAGMTPGIALLRRVFQIGPLSALARVARRVLARTPGPAWGRGETARVGASFDTSPPLAVLPIEGDLPHSGNGSSGPQAAAARALHCVNCGECNSVCPIFHESKVRLPQMLTHLGEKLCAGESIPATGSVLLDLCMRCGNCQEVCQAGIPHLPLYEVMQKKSDAHHAPDRERHVALLATLRDSKHYRQDFLQIRPGGYQQRTAASLPGVTRYVLVRAENDAGPSATCIHCAACVPVCPTNANREYEGADPRWITTVQNRCIGCGTCVEVCPANHLNGGQTLRVLEAPTSDWHHAVAEFERLLAP